MEARHPETRLTGFLCVYAGQRRERPVDFARTANAQGTALFPNHAYSRAMNPLQKLELEILQIYDRISLRPTLELVARIGSRLTEAKQLLPHGAWLPWVRRIGLKPRSAQIYMQVAAEYDGESG